MTRLLAKAQVKVAALLFTALAFVGAVAGASQAFDHHQNRQEVAAAQNRAHFWRVIAGEEAPNTPTVDNALATDLKERLGPIDRNATELPQEIRDFRGSSNSYGGITDAIGTDPFDNAGLPCQECGPLDREVQQYLLDIKRGNVDNVVRQDTPDLQDGYTMTPYGMPVVTFAGLVWAIGGPLSLAAGWSATRRHNRSLRFRDLNWRLTGAEDGTKLFIQVAALPFFLIYRPAQAITRRRFEKRVREAYPDCASLIDDVDNMLDRVSLRYGDHERVIAVQAARDELQHELESLTRSREAGDLDVYVKKMEQRVDDIRKSLDFRKESLAELEAAE